MNVADPEYDEADHWLWLAGGEKQNTEDAQDAADFRKWVEGLNKEEYTCHGCPRESKCPSAWDVYNVNGDCLEDK